MYILPLVPHMCMCAAQHKVVDGAFSRELLGFVAIATRSVASCPAGPWPRHAMCVQRMPMRVACTHQETRSAPAFLRACTCQPCACVAAVRSCAHRSMPPSAVCVCADASHCAQWYVSTQPTTSRARLLYLTSAAAPAQRHRASCRAPSPLDRKRAQASGGRGQGAPRRVPRAMPWEASR